MVSAFAHSSSSLSSLRRVTLVAAAADEEDEVEADEDDGVKNADELGNDWLASAIGRRRLLVRAGSGDDDKGAVVAVRGVIVGATASGRCASEPI